jgi:hypothetical protein
VRQPGPRGIDLVIVIRIVAAGILLVLVAFWLAR